MKVKPNNAEMTKLLNRKNIINIIRHEPVSRAQLAVRTGLTRAAITFIVNDLIEQGIIYDFCVVRADVGRYPTMLDIKADYGYFAGVLLQRSGYSVCITDFKANLISSSKLDLKHPENKAYAVNQIADKIKDMLSDAKIPLSKFMGVGVSSPGPLDYRMGVILNPPSFDIWHNTPVAKMLSESLDVPVNLENTSLALAVAEFRCGVSTEFNSSLYVKIDEAIGSAVIINGKVFRGSRGVGVEMGHSSVNIDGPQCSCGNSGCLELYASLNALFKHFSESGFTSWDQVMEGYKNGDDEAEKIFKHEIKYLSAAIANAVNMYDLDGVVISSNFSCLSDIFIKELSEGIERLSVVSKIHPVKIKIAKFDNNPELRAAAVTAIENCY